jgi:hypothetical protein
LRERYNTFCPCQPSEEVTVRERGRLPRLWADSGVVNVEARSGTGVEMAASSCCRYGCDDSEDDTAGYVGGVDGRVSYCFEVFGQPNGQREHTPRYSVVLGLVSAKSVQHNLNWKEQ